MGTFYSQDFHSILLSQLPAHGAGLDIVSGYVSSDAIYWGLTMGDVSKLRKRVPQVVPRMRVLVGMPLDGSVSLDEHNKFKMICETFGQVIRIRYANPKTHPLVHSKVYVVTENGMPSLGYLGSANFTGTGLGIYGYRQENATVEVNASEAAVYFESIYSTGIDCASELADNIFHFPDRSEMKERNKARQNSPKTMIVDTFEFPLFNVKGDRPYKPGAGINWGISSPGRVRSSPDEADLSISRAISESGFFPPRNIPFNVLCSDGTEMLMRGASGDLGTHPSGKDLSTLPSNSTLGKYIRSKLGVPSGTYIDFDVLDRYGRRFVTICRHADGSYSLDFEV